MKHKGRTNVAKVPERKRANAEPLHRLSPPKVARVETPRQRMAREKAELAREFKRWLEDAPHHFCVRGEAACFPSAPGLVVKGERFALPLMEAQWPALERLCTVAGFGKGEETLVDPKVRHALQVDAKDFHFENPAAEVALQQLSKMCIKDGLGVHGESAVVPYKLLLYGPGMHFAAPHKDSEKADGMFATLILELPSCCTGGELVVEHDGKRVECFGDWAMRPYSSRDAAFYADCLHQLSRVTEGYRLAVAYNVISLERCRALPSLDLTHLGSMVRGLFEKVLETRPYVLLPATYEYSDNGKSRGALKGSDAHLLELLSIPGLYVYMADLDHEHQQTGDDIGYGGVDWQVDESTNLNSLELLWPEQAPDAYGTSQTKSKLSWPTRSTISLTGMTWILSRKTNGATLATKAFQSRNRTRHV